MTVSEVGDLLEGLAPLAHAEDFDNVGLLVGRPETEVTGILVSLDATEAVVEEAVQKGCNLIVAFHPIVFKGLKRLNGRTYVERTVMDAIAQGVAIYSPHTALDQAFNGVSGRLAEVLGLEDREVLIPKQGQIDKLVTYVPVDAFDRVQSALFSAGAGQIGLYDECGFSVPGVGSFRPGEASDPKVGIKGERHEGKEVQLHMVLDRVHRKNVLEALRESHPYEEVAYEITPLANANQRVGMGMVGRLSTPMEERQFLTHVSDRLEVGFIRHSPLLKRKVKKVAVLGGSGSFAISAAIAAGADAFVTADLKYHQFFEAESRILLTDVGHYESEQFTKNLIAEFLKQKITTFAVTLAESRTNPIQYFTT